MKKTVPPLLTCFFLVLLIISCGQLSSTRIIDKMELTLVDIAHDTIPAPGFILTFKAVDDTSLHLKLFAAEDAIKDSLESFSYPLSDSLYKIKEVLIDTLNGAYISKVIFAQRFKNVAFNATPIIAIKIAQKTAVPIYIDRLLLRSLQ